jgi:exopolyphosphatase/guanosine-5'-triphosphate,3'-diphosphate pyrophosphatase
MGGELRESDLEAVREQLGREPTTTFSVVARCTDGHPLVIRNEPFDAANEPFPTTFWLTCPDAVRSVSHLESTGRIGEYNERFERDPGFAAAVERAHEEYARERARGFPEAASFGGVAGTRTGVKCLHAHYANHIAGGDDPIGAEVAAGLEPVHPEESGGRVAAIDLGTNSIRLLVVEPREVGRQPQELTRDMVITRIGEGVDATGRIADDALSRTVSVLERYGRRARALHAVRVRLTATSAVRDASNREQLAAAVLRETGEPMRVIDGEREAALSFLGATRGLDAPRPRLVLDIGGGSTEFALGDDAAGSCVSVELGSVRLTERYLRSDPPQREDLDTMLAEIRSCLERVQRAIPVHEVAAFVPVGGTPTTMQALSLGLERYDPDAIHRSTLTLREAERVFAHLTALTDRERAALPVMAPGRGDVMVAGAAVLVEVMRRWSFERAIVSETDILDGLAAELLESG